MPNAGAEREAQISSQVVKAMKHPKAMLFSAIASRTETPSEAAKIAKEELCLDKEEIQHTRWVALFKKGKTRAEFLLGLKELLDTPQPTEEQRMKTPVQKGVGYYQTKLVAFVEEIFGVEVRVGKPSDSVPENETYLQAAGSRSFVGLAVFRDHKLVLSMRVRSGGILLDDEGFCSSNSVYLRVQSREWMNHTKRLKRRLETLARRNQEHHTEFIIVQDFA